MGTYYNDNGDLKLISGATLWADAPIGAINAYGGTTAPSGWLLCQGQAISRTEYAELFAVIGTTYGSGDGSTTFNVPDLRESAVGDNWIIKAKQVALPADFMDALDDKQDATDNNLETTEKTVTGAINELNSNLTKKTTINEEVGTTFAKAPTYDGRLLLNEMYGMSVQDGTPTPSVPVDIQSAKANFKCVGKNLIPYPYYHASGRESNGITFIVNSDGSITADGSNTTSSSAQFDLCDNIKSILKPNTTYKLNSNGGILNTCQIFIDYQTISSTWSTLAVSSNKEVTFTTPQDFSSIAKFRVMMSVSAGKTVSNLTIKPMFTLGEVSDTSYKPYKSVQQSTDITLRAIEVTSSDGYNLERDGKYYVADTLDWDEDSGYSITRRIKRDVFDGSDDEVINLWNNTADSTQRRFAIKLSSSSKFITNTAGIVERWQGIANYLQKAPSSSSMNYEFGYFAFQCITPNSDYRFTVYDYITSPQFSSVAEFKTWLASNNLTVDYVLATPTTESITSEQAQALLGLKTYDGATYVTQTEDVEGTMVLKYGSSDFATTVLSAYVEGKENELKTSELNNDLPVLVASVTGDGVKTISAVLTELENALISSGMTLRERSYIVNNGTISRCSVPQNKIFSYAGCSTNGAQAYITIHDLTSHKNLGFTISTDGNTVLDESNKVFASGRVMSLYV